MTNPGPHDISDDICIIGMSGRFPGARDIDEFWINLRAGVESVFTLTDSDLEQSGVASEVYASPNYVRAKTVLSDIDLFAASFFGYAPREAALLDPQQRFFLECAWEALEQAGYDSERYRGHIGTFGGVGINSYFLSQLYPNLRAVDSADVFQAGLSSDKDFLTTRVGYKLNLTGPCITVQTACSTSLVAVHLACQSLLTGECDLALAGGVTIQVPQKVGYWYQEGGLFSPDGHCRAFDARAQGMIPGSGVGVVVLKRLPDAIADGDTIEAIIKGSAVNNDGSDKIGFTAPSIDGQARVILDAQAIANIDPETIGYIEAHGTGTILGDPIEIAALTQAFRTRTTKKQFCAIGSVKTNIGHLDAAAGIAGLIKTVLSLKHKTLLPSLNYNEPNPQIDFESSPFYVNTVLKEWETQTLPRRAGVSALGIGGTNAHVILEEAPTLQPSISSKSYHLLPLSAKTKQALDTATLRLADHLEKHPEQNLADIAYSLQVGRRAFEWRRIAAVETHATAITALRDTNREPTLNALHGGSSKMAVFMFPGGGAQHVNMGYELYQQQRAFRDHIDHCSELLQPHIGLDLRTLLYPSPESADTAAEDLERPLFGLPALFTTEYALAKVWMEWGIRPQAMIGHSVGEYVAACLARVFSLEDALALVALRGRLFERLPRGAMLSVPLSEREVKPLLGDSLSLAAVNAPSLCVVSGPEMAVEALERNLASAGHESHRVPIAVAAHSMMVTPILEEFRQFLGTLNIQEPQLPFVSNVSGDWIRPTQATSTDYWVTHLRATVQFASGIQVLLQNQDNVLLEVGPGHILTSLAQQNAADSGTAIIPSLGHQRDPRSQVAFLTEALGRLWMAGVSIDWNAFYAGERYRRVPLPPYPFERQRYWVDTSTPSTITDATRPSVTTRRDIAEWFFVPSWERSTTGTASVATAEDPTEACWIIFNDACGIGSQLSERLRHKGDRVILVQAGEMFAKHSSDAYTINPQHQDHYVALLKDVHAYGQFPTSIVHCWMVTRDDSTSTTMATFEAIQQVGMSSLIYLAQAIGGHLAQQPIDISVVSTNVHDVTGNEVVRPEKATILAPCTTIPQEYPNITCRSIDIELPASGEPVHERGMQQLFLEIALKHSPEPVVAYRGPHRWVQTFIPVYPEMRRAPLPPSAPHATALRERGVYLITGGLGGIGLLLAEFLAKSVMARLVLVARSPLPPRNEWADWLIPESANGRDQLSRDILDTRATEYGTGEIEEARRIISKILEMEKLGAEVEVLRADVADANQMEQVLARTHTRFGALHGVIHTAAVPGGGLIQLTTPQNLVDEFHPKVHGALVLDALLSDVKLDFVLLCSSHNAVLGGPGQVAYCAANAFLDAFAHYKHQMGTTSVMSVNWERWQHVGMAVEVEKRHSALAGEKLTGGLMTEQGLEAFQRILMCAPLPQVVVSMEDFRTTVQRSRAVGAMEILQALESSYVPASMHSRPQLRTDYLAPSTETEVRIAQIWQEVLGIDKIGVNDNFFELGGDSLTSLQILSRLRKSLQINVPVRRFFETSTIAHLAQHLTEENRSHAPSQKRAGSIVARSHSTFGIMPAEPDSVAEYLRTIDSLPKEQRLRLASLLPPASYEQQRLWLADQLAPGNVAYNIYRALRLRGALQVGALQQALDEMVRRHEALRTVFVGLDEGPRQVILPPHPQALPVLELLPHADEPPTAAAARQEEEIRRLADEEARRPFDLAAGPLLRTTLLRLGEREHVLLVTLHHIVADGWSMEVLVREVAALYAAFVQGAPSPLAELAIQYADYALWQREWLQGAELERQLAYWRRQLAGAPAVLELPPDRPRPALQTFRGATHGFALSGELTDQLRAWSRQEQVTLFMTLLAGFDVLLQRYTGADDVVVGTDTANRTQSETEGLIGFFVNTLALRSTLVGDPTFRQLVHQVREMTLEAYAHQDLPFEKLVEALKPERDLSRHPLFQVKFVLQNQPVASGQDLPGLTVAAIETDNGTAKYDILINIFETSLGLTAALEYATDLYDRTTMVRFARLYEEVLSTVVVQPDIHVSALKAILDAADRQDRAVQTARQKQARTERLLNTQRRSIPISVEMEETR